MRSPDWASMRQPEGLQELQVRLFLRGHAATAAPLNQSHAHAHARARTELPTAVKVHVPALTHEPEKWLRVGPSGSWILRGAAGGCWRLTTDGSRRTGA